MAQAKGPIILASASAARRALLENAGVAVIQEPARIDEEAVKDAAARDGLSIESTAELLAELKAQRTAARHPGHLVLGADQMLDCDGRRFDKPVDRGQAREQLMALRGRTHRLVSSVVAVRDDRRLWHSTQTARLTMRRFSDLFVESYLDRMGDRVLTTVGAYQLEGQGAQLFAAVDGDFFTVLGLPLLPVLEFLRGQGVLAS